MWKLNPQTKKPITFPDKIGIGKVKLIGSTVKDVAAKIKDENVTTTGK